ncbi:coiled-coil domain-containing protein 85B isoform X2 [Engystomops pustulosus]|uniref:coiled-coil domain-containing protein 85B isoform X2 n=1 Tax=Engystomops pustulosus TaxID=76066 RepID=UPI003AFA1969
MSPYVASYRGDLYRNHYTNTLCPHLPPLPIQLRGKDLDDVTITWSCCLCSVRDDWRKWCRCLQNMHQTEKHLLHSQGHNNKSGKNRRNNARSHLFSKMRNVEKRNS